MEIKNPGNTFQAFCLGWIAGIRASFPFALISSIPLTRFALLWQMFALCECIYDQSDLAVNRTQVFSLFYRLLCGSLAASLITRNKSWGSFCGCMGAFFSTYITFIIRDFIHVKFLVPQLALGFLEDVFALLLGWHILKR